MTYDETSVAETVDRLLRDASELDPSADGALDGLDQFHLGGPEAVDLLIATLALTPDQVVLDVGSGFGGPARQISRRTGARPLRGGLAAQHVEGGPDPTD